MAAFFTVNTAANGNLLIPLDNLLWVNTGSATTTDLYYANGAAAYTSDVITLTHGTEASPSALGAMIDVIQNLIVQSAQSNWKASIIDITDLLPSMITDVTIGVA